MIQFTQGNLLEADVEALVNTVNTVGVMGKGVALMFKEAFPENIKAYEAACRRKELQIGKMFVTERNHLIGPKFIINFPTKGHWRFPSRLEWIARGLDDLRDVIQQRSIQSIALPPLGAGNGGLDWNDVRTLIVDRLSGLQHTTVVVYEPSASYQNVAKRSGVEKLTPARALVAELVRRYSILGIQCTLLEVQKLAYFLERFVDLLAAPSMGFQFQANKYGPYSDRLKHLLNGLDGSYLHCDKRLADAGPFEPIRFDDRKRETVGAYLKTDDAKPYRAALEATSDLIDGFESPIGMELLATVDWLLHQLHVKPQVNDLRTHLKTWSGGGEAAERKAQLFDERVLSIALESLTASALYADRRP